MSKLAEKRKKHAITSGLGKSREIEKKPKPRTSMTGSSSDIAKGRKTSGMAVKLAAHGEHGHRIGESERVREKKPVIQPPPLGYTRDSSSKILVPEVGNTVPPGKIQAGLDKAQVAIKEMIDGFSRTLTEDYSIKEIGFSVSFSADGKFLGFGVGGATSITVTIAPTNS